jgi:hypothetical protein
MGIIQVMEIEFDQDDRGWSIKPITDEEIRTGKISDVHMVSMRPGAIIMYIRLNICSLLVVHAGL